uniref:CSON004514 protein n=1 Tax=Culicoides sonorensis TaxID=179676 RepID=A0A336LX78_CULSO
MDVVQNITSIFTADLLKSSMGSLGTSNMVVAPYFMIPIIVLAYIGTKHPNNLSDKSYSSKNLIYLDNLTDTGFQHKYNISLREIAKSKSAKVLNKLFVSNKRQLLHYVETTARRIGFEVNYIDMTYKIMTKQLIEGHLRENGWHVDKRNNIIPSLSNDTIILLNAAVFNGDWKYPFDIKYHKWIRFWTEEYRYKLVEGMHFEAVFPYAEYCDMQLVMVPYNEKHNNLALMIVLPNTVLGLNQILNQLEKHQNLILHTQFDDKNVNVDVPIFELEEKQLVTDILYKMCLGGLFRSNAILDNFLDSGKPIPIDQIDHTILLTVNGTITSPEDVRRHCPQQTEHVIDFEVNRPFLFYILDINTRIPFFSGLVTDFSKETGIINHSEEFQQKKNHISTSNCKKLE